MSAEHPLFAAWPMPELTPENFDTTVLRDTEDWVCVFMWGHDCPNCEIAKRVLLDRIDEFKDFPIEWFHVNTYFHMDLGTRFGLHGIPTFLFFKKGRLKGRATSFPGGDQFLAILQKLTKPNV